MKVLYITAECKPFSKAGGVADVAGELPPELKRQGVDIEIVTPFYHSIDSKYVEGMETSYNVLFEHESERVNVLHGSLDGVKVYFLDNDKYFGGNFCSIMTCQAYIELISKAIRDSYFNNPNNLICNISEINSLPALSSFSNPYVHSRYIPYYDDIIRFSFFSEACMELIRKKKPDIVHINDWPLSFLFGFMELEGMKQRRVLTIHNIAYQGVVGTGAIWRWNIGKILQNEKLRSKFTNPAEADTQRSVNPLCLGILLADMCNTVSPTYCQEMRKKDEPDKYFEGGHGLEGIISKQYRAGRISGILNGFNYISDNSDKSFKKKITEKRNARKEISKKFKNPRNFLLGFVGRAVEQKFLLLAEKIKGKSVLNHLLDIEGVNIIILATGIPQYENFLREIKRENLSVLLAFDAKMAKQIMLGCDAFLMPSLFEPCGITQMEAMSNATLPLVRATGGLEDTIIPYSESNKETANGFAFNGSDKNEVLLNFIDAVKSSRNLFLKEKKLYNSLQYNAFKQRFLWQDTAKEYIEKLYKPALSKKRNLK